MIIQRLRAKQVRALIVKLLAIDKVTVEPSGIFRNAVRFIAARFLYKQGLSHILLKGN